MTNHTETKALVERLRELEALEQKLDAIEDETCEGSDWMDYAGWEDRHKAALGDAQEAYLVAARRLLPQILAALEPLTREPDADEVERERQLDEAREEGFQEGYAEGQNDANCAATETFNAMLAWLNRRGMLDNADYPEGFTAQDIIDALNEHEENLVCLSKRAALTEEPGRS